MKTTYPHQLTTVLAIETSCDETACAIVQRKPQSDYAVVSSEVTATSLQKHTQTQGIVPEVAAREQLKSMLPVITQTLENHSLDEVDAVAVTVKPGLIGSLLVGVETARTLSYILNKPIVPVNHIEAHPYANFVRPSQISDIKSPIPQFPLLSWVISGGHTELYLMKSHQEIVYLGGTVDDAAGECFDKCARMLGFDYPGGPHIDRLANQFLPPISYRLRPKLPRPLLHSGDYNLSFSGLKTAFARLHDNIQTDSQYPDSVHQFLAHELQSAISDVIKKKTQQALTEFPAVKSIIISGGAAANTGIRAALNQLTTTNPSLTTFFPLLSWCTDNATMIGAYALFHPELQQDWQTITAFPTR